MGIIEKIDGHTIEVRYSGSGSIDPWTGDYARGLGVGLMGTSDVSKFVLVDGNLIYRLRDCYIPFMKIIENLSFEEAMDILSTHDSFGTLEDSKKEIDELKIENGKVKKMTPEEKRAYFEEKKRNMSNIDYTKENIKVLDSIDFSPYFKYIEKGKSVSTFISAIENDFDHRELVNNDILEGYIFDWLSESEIVEYFEKRYPDKFKTIEYTEYRFC